MRFAAMFFDTISPSELDPDLTRAHFDYLALHSAQITMAGGLRLPGGDAFCGSLWIIETSSFEQANGLVENDPYCLAGLRPNYDIYLWNAAPIPAYPDFSKRSTDCD